MARFVDRTLNRFHRVKSVAGGSRRCPRNCLLLLPFDATGKSFDLAVAYRILDKQLCLEGKLPDVLQVVAYRLDTSGRVDVNASLTHLESIQTKKFYTNDDTAIRRRNRGKGRP